MERNYQEVKFGVPTGYRFCPPDDLLIMDYLMSKIMGYKLPVDMITEIDLYAYDPPLLPKSKWFFFSFLLFISETFYVRILIKFLILKLS